MVWIKVCQILYSLTTGNDMSVIALKHWLTNCAKVKKPYQFSDIGTSSPIWLRTEPLKSLGNIIICFRLLY